MKVLFMGTPEFAIPTLEQLVVKHEVVGVVTQPDKPKGRGNHIVFSPIKEIAIKHNIPIIQPKNVKDKESVEKIKSFDADIFVVVAYGQILSEEILYMPKYDSINVHGSLLPKYRGAAPIQWAVIDGEKTTGITTMYMDKGMDTGDMILKREIPILLEDTTETLYSKLSILGADLLIETLELIPKGEISRIPQNNNDMTMASMLKKEMGLINWDKTSIDIFNHIRGMNPWPTSYTNYNNKIIKILKADVVNNIFDFKPGTIVDISNEFGIIVATFDGAIGIKELQLHGGKKLYFKDFINGNQIKIGELFN